ncbi:SREBP regulating gene protein-like isoform X1 [Tamandua tetradactyla]|uniref:SREBP regulating gene protein-like isoform X1 n=1 Tax=Tamandua tetradactyla TaxID=48850 RepID=UPI004053BF99
MVNLEAMVCCYLLHKRWVLTLVFGLLLVNFLTGIFKQEEREPNKQLLKIFLNQAAMASQNLLVAVEDHFELCLAKCRISSQSVKHKNTYRDPVAKYCYN